MSNTPQKKRKKLTLSDIILYALAIFMFFRIPWSNMNSFHFLIFFLFILCLMLRISNMRKMAMKEMARQRKQAAEEAAANAQQEASAETAESMEPPEEKPNL